MPATSRTGRSSRRTVSARATNRAPSRWAMLSSRRVLYRSEAATAAAYSVLPSIANHRSRPGGSAGTTARTLFAIATCVCRSGSPSRDSRWSNAAAINPCVSSWYSPRSPIRVKTALRSSQPIASATASWCAASTSARTRQSPSAHSSDTDFTGVNTRS